VTSEPTSTTGASAATVAPSDAGAATLGRARRLRRLGGERGIIAGIAIDHRDSLRVMLERRGISGTTTADLQSLKLRLTRALAPAATAIMLDEELGGLALEAGAVPSWVGLIMPLEAQGYETAGAGQTTALLDDFSPAEALRYGADACKLLLPYRADEAGSSARQEALVVATAGACHDLGLPLVIEPVVSRRPSETAAAYADAYTLLVLAAVARLQALGADLLKLPFPVLDMTASTEAAALDACRALAAACAHTPWVLLGAGVDTDTFVEQIRLAGAAGAAGFLAGRGIWGAALGSDADEAERIATRVCRPEFERCREMAERTAKPLALVGIG
jgi:tagatose-1,6-bisphosphate aldolase